MLLGEVDTGFIICQRARTDLALEFNRRMGAHCAAQGIPFLDLDAGCQGEDG